MYQYIIIKCVPIAMVILYILLIAQPPAYGIYDLRIPSSVKRKIRTPYGVRIFLRKSD